MIMDQAYTVYYGVSDSLGRIKKKQYAGLVTSIEQVEVLKSQVISMNHPKSVMFEIYQVLPLPFINNVEEEYGQSIKVSNSTESSRV